MVGIIGRNEAGKNTLLKILSRITERNVAFREVGIKFEWKRNGVDEVGTEYMKMMKSCLN